MSAMHTLTLDFQNNRRKAGWPNLLLLISGLIAMVFVVMQFAAVFGKMNTLEEKRAFLERKAHHTSHVAPLSPAEAQQLRAEIKDANTVLSQLSLPWDRLFNDIGASQQSQIALLSIVPDASKRTIKISGEGKDLSAILAYIRQLQAEKSLKFVYLQNHQVETRSAQRPVHFTILAMWMQTP